MQRQPARGDHRIHPHIVRLSGHALKQRHVVAYARQHRICPAEKSVVVSAALPQPEALPVKRRARHEDQAERTWKLTGRVLTKVIVLPYSPEISALYAVTPIGLTP